jgi:hypothetical protein
MAPNKQTFVADPYVDVAYVRPEWADDERIDRIKSQLSRKRLARVGSGFITSFGTGGAHSLIPRVDPED